MDHRRLKECIVSLWVSFLGFFKVTVQPSSQKLLSSSVRITLISFLKQPEQVRSESGLEALQISR